MAATSAGLALPAGLAVAAVGDVYIADHFNSRIRKLTVSTGMLTTVAGNGAKRFEGDGGAATAAALGQPFDVAVDSAGNRQRPAHPGGL